MSHHVDSQSSPNVILIIQMKKLNLRGLVLILSFKYCVSSWQRTIFYDILDTFAVLF